MTANELVKLCNAPHWRKVMEQVAREWTCHYWGARGDGFGGCTTGEPDCVVIHWESGTYKTFPTVSLSRLMVDVACEMHGIFLTKSAGLWRADYCASGFNNHTRLAAVNAALLAIWEREQPWKDLTDEEVGQLNLDGFVNDKSLWGRAIAELKRRRNADSSK